MFWSECVRCDIDLETCTKPWAILLLVYNNNMSHDMSYPTMLYVQPAKPKISLGIRTAWSEPLLVTWLFYEY